MSPRDPVVQRQTGGWIIAEADGSAVYSWHALQGDADARLAELVAAGRAPAPAAPAIEWRCFHCGQAFTRDQERHARAHFGADSTEQPVCLIRSAGEGALLAALRAAQEELARYRAEDSDLMRALCAMQADHTAALRREEERGYARGMADARAEEGT